jgi:hypothetical protein
MVDDDERRALPAEIWPALENKLWHATHIDKALAIVSDGEIRSNAPSKYVTGYCRSLGGISLFDFREPVSNVTKAMHCGWLTWLRGHSADDEDEIGVWFEIDATLIIPHIAATEIWAHWYANRTFDQQGLPRFRDPMPFCEACHIGSISLQAVKGVLLIDGRRLADHSYAGNDGNLSNAIVEFRAVVRSKPPLLPTLGDKLREARKRYDAKLRTDKITGGVEQ